MVVVVVMVVMSDLSPVLHTCEMIKCINDDGGDGGGGGGCDDDGGGGGGDDDD